MPDNVTLLANPEEHLPRPVPANLTADEKRREMREFNGEFQPVTKPPKQSLTLRILKDLPLFAGLLGSVDGGANAIEVYVKTTHRLTVKLASAGKGLTLAGLGLDAANFLLVPLTAAVAYFVNEKPPFTLSNGAKWAYSAAVLGLGLAAFFVPAVAPFLIGGVIFLGFATSVVAFGKLFKDRNMHKSEFVRLTADIVIAKDELNAVKEMIQGPIPDGEIHDWYTKYEKKKQQIQAMVNEKDEHKSRYNLKDDLKMMDKGVSMALMALTLLGAGLTIAFPPVGLMIMAGAAAAVAAYIVGRFAVPRLARAGRALAGLFGKKEAASAQEEVQDVPEQAELNQEPEPELVQVLFPKPVPAPDNNLSDRTLSLTPPDNSDAMMSRELGILEARDLKALNTVIDAYVTKLEAAIQQHDSKALLRIVNDMDRDIRKYNTSPDMLDELLHEVPGWPEKARSMLEDALKELPPENKQRGAFFSSSVLQEVLDIREKRIYARVASSQPELPEPEHPHLD